MIDTKNLNKLKVDYLRLKKVYDGQLISADFIGSYFINHYENHGLCFIYTMSDSRDKCYYRYYDFNYGFRETAIYKERLLDCKILNKEESDVEVKKLWKKILDEQSKEFLEKMGIKREENL